MKNLGIKNLEYKDILGLNETKTFFPINENQSNNQDIHLKILPNLNTNTESQIFQELTLYTESTQKESILIRYLTDNDFALYESRLFEDFMSMVIHSTFIARTKRAIERIGGRVIVIFMNSDLFVLRSTSV